MSSSGCWVTCALLVVAWWLITSGLLWGTWNKVIKAFFNVKAAKYSQALLLVATLLAFAAPIVALKKKCGAGHGCGQSKSCRNEHHSVGNAGGAQDDDGECPYAAKEKAEAAAKKK